MTANVLIDRESAIGGEWLVARCWLQFFLGGLRQRCQLIEAFKRRRTAGQLALVKRVVRAACRPADRLSFSSCSFVSADRSSC